MMMCLLENSYANARHIEVQIFGDHMAMLFIYLNETVRFNVEIKK